MVNNLDDNALNGFDEHSFPLAVPRILELRVSRPSPAKITFHIFVPPLIIFHLCPQ